LADKRAEMAMTVVGLLALLLVIGIFFYWFFFELAPWSEHGVGREACRDSVLLRTQAKIMGKTTLQELSCTTDMIELSSSDESEIKEVISGELYDCWYQFAEGKKDFLSDFDWGNGDNYCFICSRIDFSERVQEDIPEIKDLVNYLGTTPLQLHSGKSFFEYMYDDQSSKIDSQAFSNNYLTSEPFYVVFFADKRFEFWDGGFSDISRLASTFVGGAWTGAKIGGPWGAVIGGVGSTALTKTSTKTEFVSGLYFGSGEEVIGACNQ